MKLNFGHGIFIFIVLFMAGILFLVYKCSHQQVDLVNTTYYEQELKYSEQITKEKNSLQLTKGLKIGYDQNQHIVTFNYPASVDFKSLIGNITFYKPDNASFDFSKPVSVNQQFRQVVSTSGLAHGFWSVKVNWSSGRTPYYNEEKIFVD